MLGLRDRNAVDVVLPAAPLGSSWCWATNPRGIKPAKRYTAGRVCTTQDCGCILSVYNPRSTCGPCQFETMVRESGVAV